MLASPNKLLTGTKLLNPGHIVGLTIYWLDSLKSLYFTMLYSTLHLLATQQRVCFSSSNGIDSLDSF